MCFVVYKKVLISYIKVNYLNQKLYKLISKTDISISDNHCVLVEFMRGYLKLMVLSLLKKEELTGSKLMCKIKQETSTRPSPGSIYPLLNKLTEDKLIKFKEEGKEKTYKLTIKGAKELDKLFGKRREIFKSLRSNMKEYGSEVGSDFNDLDKKTSKKDENKLIKAITSWLRLKEAIIKFTKTPVEYKIKHSNSITKKINKLAKDIEKLTENYEKKNKK